MTNYVKTTNFLRKDSLPDASPEKIIRGSEFDTEFNNLVIAVASKANLISPAFSGIPTAPTASAGSATTQLATTAFVAQNAILSGMILMWSGPVASIPLGYFLCNGENGTPNLIDRMIMGAGSTYSPGNTGGYSDGQIVNHTHTATTASAGTHTHSGSTTSAGNHRHTQFSSSGTIYGSGSQQPAGPGSATAYTGDAGAHTHAMALNNAGNHSHSLTTANPSGGVSVAGRNLPPYYALAFIMKA